MSTRGPGRPPNPPAGGPDLREVHLGRLGLKLATRMVLERGRIRTAAELVDHVTKRARVIEGLTPEMDRAPREALEGFLRSVKGGGA